MVCKQFYSVYIFYLKGRKETEITSLAVICVLILSNAIGNSGQFDFNNKIGAITNHDSITKYPFNKWEPTILKKANTAKKEVYLTEDEKEVIFYLNLVRLDPELFSETYVQKCIDSLNVTGYMNSKWGEEELPYITSLQTDLKAAEKMGVLYPAYELYVSADTLAIELGITGRFGHLNYQKRMAPVKNMYNGKTGEDITYGYQNPLGIVLGLLIDDRMEGVGHRKIILPQNFRLFLFEMPFSKISWPNFFSQK